MAPRCLSFVIPAKAGIQGCKSVLAALDPPRTRYRTRMTPKTERGASMAPRPALGLLELLSAGR
jgi:hypothetical protein